MGPGESVSPLQGAGSEDSRLCLQHGAPWYLPDFGGPSGVLAEEQPWLELIVGPVGLARRTRPPDSGSQGAPGGLSEATCFPGPRADRWK